MHIRTVGFTLIVIGMLMFVSGVVINPNFHNLSSQTITTEEFANYTHYDNGLYVTMIPSNMTAQTTCIDVFVNPTSSGPGNISVLAPIHDLSKLRLSNVHDLGIKPSSNDSENIWFNDVPAGSYVFVESQNNSKAMSITPSVPLITAGVLTFIGAILIFVGFVIAILSIFIRRRERL